MKPIPTDSPSPCVSFVCSTYSRQYNPVLALSSLTRKGGSGGEDTTCNLSSPGYVLIQTAFKTAFKLHSIVHVDAASHSHATLQSSEPALDLVEATCRLTDLLPDP